MLHYNFFNEKNLGELSLDDSSGWTIKMFNEYLQKYLSIKFSSQQRKSSIQIHAFMRYEYVLLSIESIFIDLV